MLTGGWVDDWVFYGEDCDWGCGCELLIVGSGLIDKVLFSRGGIVLDLTIIASTNARDFCLYSSTAVTFVKVEFDPGLASR